MASKWDWLELLLGFIVGVALAYLIIGCLIKIGVL